MPPTTLTNTSCSWQRQLGVAVHDRQQHRQAVGIESLGDAPRRAEAHAIDQRLQLDQQRPAAIARHRDDAAGAGSRRARDRKIADGLRTSLQPASVMAKKPSSLTAPKRFLVARTMR